jgi:adenosylcobinamide-phosphate synthase
MDITVIVFYLSILTDIIIGDPRRIIHPTQIMGWLIVRLELLFRWKGQSPLAQRMTGSLLVIVVVAGTYSITYYFLKLCLYITPLLALAAEIWLLSTTIAIKGLSQAGLNIYHLLIQGNVTEARLKLAEIVGRDTEMLPEPEIVRGAVESVSENTVDGIISPLFFAMIGGVPLAMAYRAINTLDSMLGYRNECYKYFGTAAARLDDIANYLPARITGVCMIAAAFFLRLDYKRSWNTIIKDARKHPSPNSGIPESAVAGALGIRLGGINYYQGQPSVRAFLGEDRNSLVPNHIRHAIFLMAATTVIFMIIAAIFFIVIGFPFMR